MTVLSPALCYVQRNFHRTREREKSEEIKTDSTITNSRYHAFTSDDVYQKNTKNSTQNCLIIKNKKKKKFLFSSSVANWMIKICRRRRNRVARAYFAYASREPDAKKKDTFTARGKNNVFAKRTQLARARATTTGDACYTEN